MKCFNCGAVLKATDYCHQCGADVTLYRKMLQLSNAYYNAGLEKAKVKDLSGAVSSLRKSLKINKKNTNARNLLGLVYFEMGETVEALSQWIISKSFQRKKNLASYFIDDIQNSPARLETINTTIKKFNQSLLYCEQESYDLAIIQLKKILSVNPNLIKGHQLLALLYMRMENYRRARSELKKILEIDYTNTTALRYLQELDEITGKPSPKTEEETNKDAIAYTSGNETIIQPVGVKDNSGLHSIINVVIGIAIGAAVMWFLVFPAQQRTTNDELNRAIADYSDQLESKTAALENLQNEIDAYEKEAQQAKQTAEEVTGRMTNYEELLSAYSAYAAGEDENALDQLTNIDKDSLTEEQQVLYDAVFNEVGTKMVAALYKSGYGAYEKGNYETAIQDLSRCFELDETNADALFYLARSYQRSGDAENAKVLFQRLLDEMPGSRRVPDATTHLNSLR